MSLPYPIVLTPVDEIGGIPFQVELEDGRMIDCFISIDALASNFTACDTKEGRIRTLQARTLFTSLVRDRVAAGDEEPIYLTYAIVYSYLSRPPVSTPLPPPPEV
ncbi:hypothetical protein GCM10007860_02220 [Chitiniphilus shinanonensis]|uniref:DUF1488 family protein n=1 Tax=Chitiniphilus shinanonensis TaxID=553088 RepID=A0ABQ6BNQ1_9NEIS|nr:hypothetical protein [Chitiniphilus shinanonensis]GLS03079.1 hypothetical protein GCM10007860_02220 [Chitiniphilus shinanonensis]